MANSDFVSIGLMTISSVDPISHIMSYISNNFFSDLGICFSNIKIDENYRLCGEDLNCKLFSFWSNSSPVWCKYFNSYRNAKFDLASLSNNHFYLLPFIQSVHFYPIKEQYREIFKICSTKLIMTENYLEQMDYKFYLKNLSDDEEMLYNTNKICMTGFDVIDYLLRMLNMTGCEKNFGNTELRSEFLIKYFDESIEIFSNKNATNWSKTESIISFIDLMKQDISDFALDVSSLYFESEKFRTFIFQQKHENILRSYINLHDLINNRIKSGETIQDELKEFNLLRTNLGFTKYDKNVFYHDKRDEFREQLFKMYEIFSKILEDHADFNRDLFIIQFDQIVKIFNQLSEKLNIPTIKITNKKPVLGLLLFDVFHEEKKYTVKYADFEDIVITPKIERLDNLKTEDLQDILKTLNEVVIFDPSYITLQNRLTKELSERK